MPYKKILSLTGPVNAFPCFSIPMHELQSMYLLQEDDRIITQLLETIEDLMKQSPELFRNEPPLKPEKSLMTPTPPRRNRVSKYSDARL